MRAKTKSVVRTLSLLIIVLGLSCGCSPASYSSTEGIVGGLAGSAVGSGVGALIGSQAGNMGTNIALNAAIGGGMGLLSGAILHEHNLQVARDREIVLREAELIDENQRSIDLLRDQVNETSSWGKNEVKSWDERYPAENLELPYQGPGLYLSPRE